MPYNLGYVDSSGYNLGYTGAYSGYALVPYTLVNHGTPHPNSLVSPDAKFNTTGTVRLGVVTDFDPLILNVDWQAISDGDLWLQDINTLSAVTVNATEDTVVTATMRYLVVDTGVEGQYTITATVSAITATVSISYTAGTGRQVVTLTSWAGDAVFPTLPVAGDQIEGPDTLTIDATGAVTGPNGVYTLRHIIATTGVIETIEYVVGQLSTFSVAESAVVSEAVTFEKQLAATTTITYQAPADKTQVTLVDPIEPYVFQDWTTQPVAGEQLVSTTAEGVFDQYGNWSGDVEGVYSYWFIGLDGMMHQHTIDTAGLPAVTTVTALASFGFGVGNTTTTLVAPVDQTAFAGWAIAPVAGDQVTIADSNGSFSANGTLTTSATTLIDVYHTDGSGGIYARQVDPASLNAPQNISEEVTVSDFATMQKIATFAVTESTAISVETQLDADYLYVSEDVTVSDSAIMQKIATFTVAESTSIDTELSQTVEEVKVFTLEESATASTFSAILPIDYITPVITLPATDLNGGYSSNYQTAEIELYQGSWHKLVAPINIGGETVTNISRARLQLFRGPEVVLTLTLNDRISFKDSTLYIELDESDTVNLIQGYQYELWIVDLTANPLFVHSGKIVVKPTQLRF